MKKSKTAAEAMKQVRRLKSKPFYPVMEIGEDSKPVNIGEQEMARTLYEYAESDTHMRAVIDQAVIRHFGDGDADRCPSPHDIWALCRDINPAPVVKSVVDRDCPECEGFGFQIVLAPYGISGAAACPRGCRPADYFATARLNHGAVFEFYRRELEQVAIRRQMPSPVRRTSRASADARMESRR